MFSLGLCWLLSWLTVGTVTAGIPKVFTNGEIGTDPPLVLFFTGSIPNVFFNDFTSHLPISESISVLNAS